MSALVRSQLVGSLAATAHQIIWTRITEDRFNDMLGAVPPAYHVYSGFLLGEAWSHRTCRVTGRRTSTFRAFRRIGSEYFECGEDMTIAEFKQVRDEDVLATANQ